MAREKLCLACYCWAVKCCQKEARYGSRCKRLHDDKLPSLPVRARFVKRGGLAAQGIHRENRYHESTEHRVSWNIRFNALYMVASSLKPRSMSLYLAKLAYTKEPCRGVRSLYTPSIMDLMFNLLKGTGQSAPNPRTRNLSFFSTKPGNHPGITRSNCGVLLPEAATLDLELPST